VLVALDGVNEDVAQWVCVVGFGPTLLHHAAVTRRFRRSGFTNHDIHTQNTTYDLFDWIFGDAVLSRCLYLALAAVRVGSFAMR